MALEKLVLRDNIGNQNVVLEEQMVLQRLSYRKSRIRLRKKELMQTFNAL
jgi:hypothetical protein